ncbi:MAG: chemotaxis protein CheW, partial [Spirochaetales bacterium]|nr:chemotaxis protein CheW [Spirochaetales bacterium]
MTDIQNTSNQYLTFTICDEQYAIPVTQIREVLTVPKINYIPRMPDAMRGVINLRGSVVPILDLKTKFEMGETRVTTETAIIVIEILQEENGVEQKPLHIGMYTDSVKKVISIPPEMIEPAPRIGTRIKTS